RVGALHVLVHPLELAAEIRVGGVGLLLQLFHHLAGHHRHLRCSSVASTLCSTPSRRYRTSILSPARRLRKANVRSSSVRTVTPAKPTMTSPDRSPARSAGLSGRTPESRTPGARLSRKPGREPKWGP